MIIHFREGEKRMEQQLELTHQSVVREARISILLMKLIISLSVVTTVSTLIEISIYSAYSNEQLFLDLSYGEMIFILLRTYMNFLWIILNIMFIIMFLTWKHWTYKNLQIAKIQGLKHEPKWAACWYFIPIVGLIKPLIIMKEIWLATFYSQGDKEWKNNKTPSPIIIWWLTFIIGISLFTKSFFRNDETIASYKMDALYNLMAEPLLVVSGIYLIMIIRNITHTQETRLSRY